MKKTLLCLLTVLILGCAAGVPLYAAEITGQPWAPGEILVKFKKGVADQAQATKLRSFGALNVSHSFTRRFAVVQVPEGTVAAKVTQLLKDPAVERATPNYVMHLYSTPNDPYYKEQWNLPLINMESAWDISTGADVTVAVVDTGVNTSRYLNADGFGNRLLKGYNAILGIEGSSFDQNCHGTHVAGTIGQETNNGIGVAGVAYDATILPVKVFLRGTDTYLNWIIDGIDWAAQNADIINLSLGGPKNDPQTGQPYDYTLLKEAIDDAVNNHGVTIIAASGNDGIGEVGYPAAFDNVIAVGAVDYTKKRAFYSNYGPELALVAPGGVTSQDPDGDGLKNGGVLQETFREFFGFRFFAFGWGYYFLSGTSMATPHVSGVAALIKAKHPAWGPQQIRDALINSAEDLGTPGRDDEYGYGLVDAFAALQY
ncbi:MAG: S8 family serine peptidase [Proteobacteria bacterium]|nr:S8 family serine peptidase [Pseudomonadota bacterium]